MRRYQPERISYLHPGISLMILIVFSVCWCFSSLAQSESRDPSSAQVSSNANTAVTTELRRAADLLQSGKLDEAEPILHRVLASNPSNADAHNLLGVIQDQRGTSAEAEREYRAALRLNPNHVSALANLGVLLAHSKREDEAIKIFESVRRLAPDHPQATINLGMLYVSSHDYQRAAELLARANELQPYTFDILYHLGVALYNLKRLNEANSAFDSAAALPVT